MEAPPFNYRRWYAIVGTTIGFVIGVGVAVASAIATGEGQSPGVWLLAYPFLSALIGAVFGVIIATVRGHR